MYFDNMTYYVELQSDVLHLPWSSERGELMQSFREQAGLTRSELAKKLSPIPNASIHQLRKLEIGKGADLVKGIDSTLFLGICKLLNVHPAKFKYSVLAQLKENIDTGIDTNRVT